MIRTLPMLRLTTIAAFSCATACSPPEDDDFWFQPTSSVESSTLELPKQDQDAVALSLARAWVLEEVAQISKIRVWDDTVVGVVDAMACQVVLISITAEVPRYMRRFGSCGDGPGEFREPTDIYLDGDTLIVSDVGNRRITFLPVDGHGSREVHLPQLTNDPWAPLDILASHADGIVLTASLPGGGVSARTGMIRTVRRGDGELVASHLPDPLFPGKNPATHLRRISACWESETNRIVVANRWRAEILVLDPESWQTTARLISPVPWIAANEPSGSSGGLAPAAFVRLRCGRGSALILWKGRPGTAYADRYQMVIITANGTVELLEQGLITDEEHTARLGVAGRTKDGWLLYTNSDPAGPKLYEFLASTPISARMSE